MLIGSLYYNSKLFTNTNKQKKTPPFFKKQKFNPNTKCVLPLTYELLKLYNYTKYYINNTKYSITGEFFKPNLVNINILLTRLFFCVEVKLPKKLKNKHPKLLNFL
jgi:hypothetical protein